MPDGIVRPEGLRPVADGSQGGARDADHGRHCDGGEGLGSGLLVCQEAGRLWATASSTPPARYGGSLRLQRLPLSAHRRRRGLRILTRRTLYAMKHLSPILSSQQCKPCHARVSITAGCCRRWSRPVCAAVLFTPRRPPDAPLPRPAATIVTWSRNRRRTSRPRARSTYALKAGGTSTNGAQWMNHGSSLVAGKDCAVCHLADARPDGQRLEPVDLAA